MCLFALFWGWWQVHRLGLGTINTEAEAEFEKLNYPHAVQSRANDQLFGGGGLCVKIDAPPPAV